MAWLAHASAMQARIALCVLGVATLALAGCGKKDKSKNDSAKQATPPPKTGTPEGKPPPPTGKGSFGTVGGQAPASITQALAKLPRDPSMVAAFNFRQMRATEMYKTSPGLFLGLAKSWHEELKRKCGIDLIKQLDLVMVAKKDDVQFILVDGTISKQAIDECARTSKMKVKVSGKVTTYNDADWEEPKHVAFLSDTQILTSENLEALNKLLARKSPGAGAQPMYDELVTKIDRGATMWAIGTVPKEFPADMMGMREAPTHFWVHALYQGNAQLKIGVRFPNDAAAEHGKAGIQKMTKSMGGSSPSARQLVRSLEYRLEDNDLEIHATLTADQVKNVSQMAGGPR